jgi:3-oxoacyl-[acyl-carrier-protein] synthase II
VGKARRVVVTGLGPVTAIGIGRKHFWEAALEGRSGARTIEYPWMDQGEYTSHVGAPVTGFDPGDYAISPRDRRLLDPVACFTLGAARLALEDGGLRLEPAEGAKSRGRWAIEGVDPRRVAVVLGTGIGGLSSFEQGHSRWTESGNRKGVPRYALPMLIPNALPGQVGIWYGARGECKAVCTSCSAGTMAIGDAYRLVRDGEADLALTGGADAVISDRDGYGLMAFDRLRAVSTWREEPERASRPFDRDRAGFVLGEGAAVLLLEDHESARARGATVYAELAGYGTNSDGHSMMQLAPEGEEITRMMVEILERSGTAPSEIDYLNAHGTGTVPNDPLETACIRKAFGPHADSLMVSATKSMTGHAIGGSGAIEAVATALSIHEGRVHPTINLDHADPACDLDYVPHRMREARVRAALTNSYGFGGHNACLLMRAV